MILSFEIKWEQKEYQPQSDANAFAFANSLVSFPTSPLLLHKTEIENLPHTYITKLDTHAWINNKYTIN